MIAARRDLAEDAVQQAFARLLERGRPAGLASVEAFLRTVVRNEAYRLLAKRQRDSAGGVWAGRLEARRHVQDAPLLEPAGDPGDQAAGAEERERLERAIRQLTAEQRELVHLKVYEGLTFAQIGEMLNIPLNTAASRYRYAMQALREMLAEKRSEK